MDRLFAAFRNNTVMPSVEEFVAALKRKIQAEAHISLRLGRPSKAGKIDIKAPTASGKVGESAEEYHKKDLFDDEK